MYYNQWKGFSKAEIWVTIIRYNVVLFGLFWSVGLHLCCFYSFIFVNYGLLLFVNLRIQAFKPINVFLVQEKRKPGLSIRGGTRYF